MDALQHITISCSGAIHAVLHLPAELGVLKHLCRLGHSDKAMKVVFNKISSYEHLLSVTRRDGSSDSITLNSRSYLRHDFAHFAVESEVPIQFGYWGSVAEGLSLTGEGIGGKDIALAESLAGPVQTLIRTGARPPQYLQVLNRVKPSLAATDLATRIHSKARALAGHWKATPFGNDMTIEWREYPNA